MSFPNFALHATPVDRVAARVSFGESEAWEPKRGTPSNETFDFPPVALMARPNTAPDYSGFRRSRMTAARYHSGGKNGSVWLCRCDCGRYELRKVARWVKNADHTDCCNVCEKTFQITHGHAMNQTAAQKKAGIKAHLAKLAQMSLEAPA